MFKSYNFWIRLVAVVVLLLRIVGAEFGFSVDSGLIIDLATAIASVLVVLGVIQVPVEKNAVSSSEVGNSENKQNIGGKLVMTFEQIKEDILTVKEKIASSLTGEESVKGEIAVILDGIIQNGEKEKVDDVSLPVEGEVIQMNEKGEIIVGDGSSEVETVVVESVAQTEEGLTSNEVEGVGVEEVLLDETKFDEVEVTLQEETNESTQSAENVEEENKLAEIVRRKIYEVLEKEIDGIIEEVMA